MQTKKPSATQPRVSADRELFVHYVTYSDDSLLTAQHSACFLLSRTVYWLIYYGNYVRKIFGNIQLRPYK
jgi:hypothetical protein